MKTWGKSGYVVELANKIRNGRAVGNLYVVTRRGVGMTGILSTHETKGAALRWIRDKLRGERKMKKNPSKPKHWREVRNRWGRLVRVGSFVTAHHPRGGEISGVVKRIKRMSGYGLRAELDNGHSISLDDVKKARTKHAGKIPRVVFSPFADIRGSRVVFARDLFANRDSMHKNRWFVFGYSTDRQYGGHYVRRVAWPKDQPKKSRGFLRGFANQAEAKRVARALKRYARIKGLTK